MSGPLAWLVFPSDLIFDLNLIWQRSGSVVRPADYRAPEIIAAHKIASDHKHRGPFVDDIVAQRKSERKATSEMQMRGCPLLQL